MTQLYAQPYNISAEGFYFTSVQEYEQRSKGVTDDFGLPVEEFEIQFIDGEAIDADLAKAWGVNQANLRHFLRAVEEWCEDGKTRFIVAVGECGYRFDPESVDPADFDVDLYPDFSLKDLAIQFVDDGLFGQVGKFLEFYIDYDAIARTLTADYTETEIGGKRLIYRCG